MTEQYQITIQSQLGPRNGVLTLQYRESCVTGSLSLVGFVNAVQGSRTEDGVLCLSHLIRTAVSTLECDTRLKLYEGGLYGTTKSEHAGMQWEGVLLRREP